MHDGPHSSFAMPDPAAVHCALHAPAPHATCVPLHDDSPPHVSAHGAFFGQRSCTAPQLLVPVH